MASSKDGAASQATIRAALMTNGSSVTVVHPSKNYGPIDQPGECGTCNAEVVSSILTRSTN